MPIDPTATPSGSPPAGPGKYESTVEAWGKKWKVIYTNSDSTASVEQISRKLDAVAQKIFEEVATAHREGFQQTPSKSFDLDKVQGIGFRMEDGNIVLKVHLGKEEKTITRPLDTTIDQAFQEFQELQSSAQSKVALRQIEIKKRGELEQAARGLTVVVKDKKKDKQRRFNDVLEPFLREHRITKEEAGGNEYLLQFTDPIILKDFLLKKVRIQLGEDTKLNKILNSIIEPPQK